MNIITDLYNVSSKTEKLNILKCATEIEKKCFQYAYNPFMRFHIANLFTDLNKLGSPSEDMFRLLDKIANRTIIGNAARDALDDFEKENGYLIKLICNKDLECGVAATSLNKVFGSKFIPTFKVQLAKEVPVESLTYPLLAQIKFDGVRVIMILKEGKAVFKTRNGKTINIPGLANIFEANPNVPDCVLDGELTLLTGKSSERTSISGKVNSALHGGSLNFAEIVFNVFDFLTVKEFENQKNDVKYENRYTMASLAVDMLNTPCVTIAKNYHVNSADEANQMFSNALEEGYEGLVLKSPSHKYTFKRSKDWVKVKAVKTTELMVYDFKPGTGKYEGKIGSLVCEGHVEGRHVQVNVGSGLTDNDREHWEAFNQSIIEVKYNDVIVNHEEDGHTLFLPRFVCIREDLQ